MQRLGYVRSNLDIKILILYFLSKMREPATRAHLNELAYIDGAIDYFVFMDCLANLEETGHIEETSDGYILTGIGVRNCELCQTSLSYTVRQKAEKMAEEFTASVRRGRKISTSVTTLPGGDTITVLKLHDNGAPIMSLEINAQSREFAKNLEDGFKNKAEMLYGKIIEMLTEEEK
ncbi:MAG: DUF4364 family protein [Oscillospiraceae bacterium]|nr:DUF4364 family protein [Oscillospiraceae bacterium]